MTIISQFFNVQPNSINAVVSLMLYSGDIELFISVHVQRWTVLQLY